ncbi:hypothetical protein ACJIZ3_009849 [Penstemon smallii]|uniref:Diacylglycerol O-acyltransferase n=1 Tax=Penstemon smallii TaxID=265156 RepID=A0ABD3TFZ6_9LAMI
MTTSLGEEPASPTARLMHAPSFNLHILAFLGFTTPIDVNVFKNGFQQTLLKHPRFSSVLVVDGKNCNKMSWKRINADINNHVLIPSLDPNIDLSPDKFVEDYASRLSTIPMDLTKPLWELHILNLQTSDANSTAIFKFHHSMGDGVSLISILLACSKQTLDPQSFPTIPFKKQKFINAHDHLLTRSSYIKNLLFFVWLKIVIIFNTLIHATCFIATILFLKDTQTPIKGSMKVEHSPKRFVHRIVSLDDIKLVKTAMNVSINDVVLGVTQAGISQYLNGRYEKVEREKGSVGIAKKSNKYLPRNLFLRAAIFVNLRPTAPIQDLGELMEKEYNNSSNEIMWGWGNILGMVLLPLTAINLQDDPLTYVRKSKATMDQKKRSLEAKLVNVVIKMIVKLLGIKGAAALTRAVLGKITVIFSNVVGPREEITLNGHPLCYLAPTGYGVGIPQALVIHYQSYANKLIISIAVDENVIPDPHQFCDVLEDSLKNIKDAVIKSGLALHVDAGLSQLINCNGSV